MHPETKKLTQKHTLGLSNTDRKSKATTKPWFSRYDIQPGNGVGLFWDKHTHTFTYLLTCPGPTRAGIVFSERLLWYWVDGELFHTVGL